MRRLAWVVGLSLALLIAGVLPQRAGAAEIDRLRNDLAMRYLEPEPYMALAKHLRDQGDRLTAFYILEEARRGKFPEAVFRVAFERDFLGQKPFDNSPQAEARLKAELADNPAADRGLADVYISRQEYAKAKPYLLQAAARQPDDMSAPAALAHIAELEGKKEEGQKILEEWVARHPQSLEAYLHRMGQVAEAKPAEARALLVKAIELFPENGGLQLALGQQLLDEKKDDEAAPHYERATQLAPDDAFIQGWAGRFFLKVRNDPRRALDLYLNAYFLDPDFYDTEYAEGRIRRISWDLAGEEAERLRAGGAKTADLLGSANPVVAARALELASEAWKPEYLEPVLRLMESDDDASRGQALSVLQAHVGREFDPRLKALLVEADLRKKGLALYIAARLWGAESLPLLKDHLGHESQLLRYDAVSALILERGEEGKKIVRAYQPTEKHPRMKEFVEAALARAPAQ